MAFYSNHPKLTSLKISEHNGFCDLDGTTIHDCADFIMTAAAAAETNHNGRSILNPFGNVIAWLLNATSPDQEISKVNLQHLLTMYLHVADAPYRGLEVQYKIHSFDTMNPISRNCTSFLKTLKFNMRTTGMEQSAEKVLELHVDGKPLGMYFPAWKCFIPGTNFDGSSIYGVTPEAFMNDNPETVKRCRALLTNLLANNAKPEVIQPILDNLGGSLSDNEMRIYRAETMTEIPEDVQEYITTTSPDADCAAVCGYMGTNPSGKLLEIPALIYTSTAPVANMNRSFKKINDELVLIPPVKDANSLFNTSYTLGPSDEDGMPLWIDFSSEIDGVLHHRVYSNQFKVCQPDHIIDMNYMVPDGILRKFNYVFKESAADFYEDTDSLSANWNVYPEDATEIVINLSSSQFNDVQWSIHQRSTRIERLELCDRDGNILGSVIPERSPAFHRTNNHMYLSLDPAGSVSVRLKSLRGTNRSGGLEYQDLVHALTPMSNREFNQAIEKYMVSPERTGTHFDSLIQLSNTESAGTWASLMVDSRIWTPDESAMFDALKSYPGSLTEAMTNLGVISNMKELLTRSNFQHIDKERVVFALKSFIGTMLLEGIIALSREGYAFHSNNLEMLISYPENGSGEGFTKRITDIIKGAIVFVNEYLADDNQLELGRNTSLYSESIATAVWHQHHAPTNDFLGEAIAAGTPDYGYSTHDYSLKANGHLYMFSLPYGALKLTNATLAKVFKDEPNALIRCFSGGRQELKNNALEAIKKAMETPNGKLHEQLGYSLSLNRLFSECNFNVTGMNADQFQKKVQELTELKLNIAIPAYAYTIVRALKDKALELDQDVLLAPVGKGSLALNNTAPDFKERFTERLHTEINHLLDRDSSFPKGTLFTGNIRLLPNNDKDKTSVARGMIDIKEYGNTRAVIRPDTDPYHHYLDLVYGTGDTCNTEAKKQFCAEIEELAHTPARRRTLLARQEELYHQAFRTLVRNYTFEKFEEAFNRFGYTGIEDGLDDIGVLDDSICNIVNDNFQNLKAQLEAQGEELVMACPHIEEEMICGALIDLAIERMDLF